MVSTGCEASLDAIATCGTCAIACASGPHSTATCSTQMCGLTCDVGFADCDKQAGTGCEVDTLTDGANCGACGKACPAVANAAATCTNGTTCGFACLAGWSDCDGNPANGCEVDIAYDIKNCGVCGNVCGAGPCISSECSTVLASGLNFPADVAIDGTSIYWVSWGNGPLYTNGSVQKMALAGGAVTTLASNEKDPSGIAIDGTSIYWTTSDVSAMGVGAVRKMPLNGGAITTIAPSENNPFYIAVDGTSVYWTDYGSPPNYTDGAIRKAPIGGGAISSLATGQPAPIDIAVDQTRVYWANAGTGPTYADGSVNSVLLGGGAVTALATSQKLPYGVGVSATQVFWTTGNDFSVWSAPLGGGASTKLAGGTPLLLAVDATNVYYTSYTANSPITRVPQAGGATTDLTAGLNHPFGIAVDGAHAYFSVQGAAANAGSIMRTGK